MSSIAANNGIPPKGEIEFVRDPATYSDTGIYAESKMLNLLFNNELSRRCPEVLCVGAHPGVCSTNLFQHRFGWARFAMQSPEMGAQSPLKAAVDPDLKSMDYLGPKGWYGGPLTIPQPPKALDTELAARDWAAMAKATGLSYP